MTKDMIVDDKIAVIYSPLSPAYDNTTPNSLKTNGKP